MRGAIGKEQAISNWQQEDAFWRSLSLNWRMNRLTNSTIKDELEDEMEDELEAQAIPAV